MKTLPDSFTPRRLTKAMRPTKPSAISTWYGVRKVKTEVSASVPAAVDTATVRM